MTTTTAGLLSIGDELAIGQTLDTNSNWLAAQLLDAGVRTIEHRTVPDDESLQAEAIAALAERADVLISTGGLGPTRDDLTRAALARAMGEELVEDEAALAFLLEIEERRGRELSPERRWQALRPATGACLHNANGTAPGLTGAVQASDERRVPVFCLPGPPREMRPMFLESVLPALEPDPARRATTRLLRSFGLPEADAGAKLGELMTRGANPTVGTTASGGIVTIRMRAEGDAGEAQRLLDEAEARVRDALGPTVFASGETTLAEWIVRSLRERSERVTVAESCTGGLLGAAITSVPGASAVFDGGQLTYANEAKRDALGVPQRLLDTVGAVSPEVASAMAEGALRAPAAGRAQHALAITGIAGPDGGTPDKPVGTVCIARAQRGAPTDARTFRIMGDRDDIRERSVTAALGMLMLHLRSVELGRPLLWEVSRSITARTD